MYHKIMTNCSELDNGLPQGTLIVFVDSSVTIDRKGLGHELWMTE